MQWSCLKEKILTKQLILCFGGQDSRFRLKVLLLTVVEYVVSLLMSLAKILTSLVPSKLNIRTEN